MLAPTILTPLTPPSAARAEIFMRERRESGIDPPLRLAECTTGRFFATNPNAAGEPAA
jgi:hypothetical protein